MSEETCHGAAVADQLGDQELDPTPELQAQCKGGAYTCALDPSMNAWDENLCTPWPGGEATTGESTEGTTTDDPTGGGPTTDDPTGGGPGTGSGGPGSDGSDGTAGSEGTGSASGGQDGLVDHGCACDSRETSPLGWLGMLAGLGLLRPRRRGRPPGT
jgi:MYXO-CTERM domain-containing protein